MARSLPRFHGQIVTDDSENLQVSTDVLVVGGGPAATWAAVAAAESGASVALVDKGYVGASGVAATAGVGHWLVPPIPERRDEEISRRERSGGFITDRVWTEAVLDEAWERTALIPEWGYKPSANPRSPGSLFGARPGERSFSGAAPDYLRFLRGKVKKSGVHVLDHSPALELLVDSSGTVSGATGYQRQVKRPWRVDAGAVILATGGTTWKSHSLGGDVNTGEGHLMAVEVGAHLSSMEFSNFYGMVPFGTSMDKNGFFVSASYWDHRGEPIRYHDLHQSRAELLGASLRGTITAQFTQFGKEMWPALRAAMPNFFMVTDKLGIDPFTERFPMDWVQEGTVRGTGGIHILDYEASTGVSGLYAAGDIAARDRIVGAATGAGGPNLSWAIATGTWAGRAAAGFSAHRGLPTRFDVEPSGTVGIRGRGVTSVDDTVRSIQSEMLPIDKAVFRSNDGLADSAARLDRLWESASSAPSTEYSGMEAIAQRESAGMLAMGRWAVRTAMARTETRGMHTRTDFPDADSRQAHRLLSGGLNDIWVEPDTELPRVGITLAAQGSAS
ncbi:FAD-binding protein [Rhodococcus sp. 24CO]|uniref:FAD-binding protein n=1 Tax=Rhodococcus sp. 24CO TaxID=3117460 RepID=UPI003D348D6C